MKQIEPRSEHLVSVYSRCGRRNKALFLDSGSNMIFKSLARTPVQPNSVRMFFIVDWLGEDMRGSAIRQKGIVRSKRSTVENWLGPVFFFFLP